MRAMSAWAVSMGALVALALPAQVSAAWSPPFDVGGAKRYNDNRKVALNAAGSAVIAWGATDPRGNWLQARRRSASGELGPIVDLASRHADTVSPQVALSPDGTAVFAWVRLNDPRSQVQVRMLSPTGQLGPLLSISAPGRHAATMSVAAVDRGVAVAWKRWDGRHFRAQARTVSRAGVLGPTVPLSGRGAHAAELAVAMAADGDTVVAWDWNRGSRRRVQARRLTLAGDTGRTIEVSAPGRRSILPQLAVAPDGAATIAWIDSPAGTDRALDRVQARTISPAGRVAPPVSVPGVSSLKQVAYPPSGSDAVITSSRFPPSTPSRQSLTTVLQSQTLSPDGTLGRPRTIRKTRAGDDARDLTLGARGDGVFAWWRTAGNIHTVRAQTRAADGTLGPRVALTSVAATPPPCSSFPCLTGIEDVRATVGATGAILVTWIQRHNIAPRTEVRLIRAAAGP